MQFVSACQCMFAWLGITDINRRVQVEIDVETLMIISGKSAAG